MPLSYGLSPFRVNGLSTTVTNVSTVSCQLGALTVYNPNASAAYLQVFNAPAVSVTLGTTPPALSFAIPASGSLVMPAGFAPVMMNAISMAATTTATGAIALATGLDVNLYANV